MITPSNLDKLKVMFASTKLVSWFAILGSLAFVLVAHVSAQPVSYEGVSFPDEEGWTRDPRMYLAARTLLDGWFVQTAEVVDPTPPEIDEDDIYRRSIAEFSGVPQLFFEWRLETDGERECIPGVAPAALTVSGQMGIFYHFTIARDRVRLIDSDLSVLYVDVVPDIPHIYRLELLADATYVWFIDGVPVDYGPAPQPYPTSDSVVVFSARACLETITDRWDYIRFGEIPDDASGDYDNDAGVTLIDHYFVVDCLSKDGPGIFGGPAQDAGPSCRFADFDADHDVDLADFAEFQDHFSGQ